ncbi:hypothetical protein L226DRAFT_543211 [Lentinus tigrinus ALCF2SS1-7]|uniref:Wings apart-like protein C-terminal domain-containing protein n=1 Tax=Lentinus tigrinus ALCF2SS1-6 TaxID=1328759 RepID=A0A5C2SR96_9APHY|nr:hypothetical protein L227DRAFT_583446 [Lentinus tigrinus ALCF2SS1-6]RPD78995.1 hypothetical protein L226DRAFT_543211 [Lentinus tigrinus ALCF2SS1-7]
MLGRSRTESSVISISSTSEHGSVEPVSIHGTPKKLRAFVSDSLVGSPSSRTQSQSPSKPQPPDDISSPPVRPSLTNTNVRTYAGKSRSFLVALPQSQAASMGVDASLVDNHNAMLVDSHEDDFEIRESYTELRQRWGVDASEDDPRPPSPQLSPSPKRKGKMKGLPKQAAPIRFLPNGMMNDLKSITELRSKGESRRFLDEVGYLFEGLEAKGALGVRRSSALEIVTKLCDVDFARRAKAADFLGRAWEVLREAGAGAGDKVLDSILSFYAALVARDPTDLLDLASKSDFASTLHHMLTSLEHLNDPLWLISTCAGTGELKAAGISKAEVTLLSGLQRLVRKKSGLFDEEDPISNRLLISQALVVVSPSAHTFSHLPSLIQSLTSELNLLPSRVDAYISGLLLFPPEGPTSYMDTPSILHLDNCLRLLDSCLLGSWSITGDEVGAQTQRLNALREEGFARAVVALCVSCNIILQDNSLEEHRSSAARCIESSLRVLINLTHEDLPWCRALLEDDFTMPAIVNLIIMAQRQRRMLEKRTNADEADLEEVDNAAHCLDRLCLALGLLTNLVQATPEGRHVIGNTLVDFDCPGQRRCLRGCTCPSRTGALACLGRIYTYYSKSQNEVDAVVRGHMAVLFGLLMERSPANQHTLLNALPGPDNRSKLAILLQHAQDFTLFYVALSRKMAEASREGDADEEDEERILDQPSASGSVLRDTKGETVAKGVVAFLKRLRDDS